MLGVIWAVFALPSVRAAAPATGPLVRFTVFGLRSTGDVAFVPKPGATLQTIRFYPTARSPRYEYRGSLPLRFVDPETKILVAEAVIPSGAGEVLLVLSPTAGGKATGAPRYDVTVLDDSLARHPVGSLVILNLSGLVLNGTVNDRAVAPEEGPNAPLSVGRSLSVRLTTSFKNRVVLSYAATTPLGRDERALLVLFPPFRAGTVEAQARLLVDRPPGGPRPLSRP